MDMGTDNILRKELQPHKIAEVGSVDPKLTQTLLNAIAKQIVSYFDIKLV